MTFPRYFRIVLAVLWTAFIVYGLSSKPNGIPTFPWLEEPGVDKLIHAILFAVEASLLAFVFGKTERPKLWLPILAWCFILGGGLEIFQHFWIVGRSGDVVDLLADAVGTLLGLQVIMFLRI
ncbi:MAG: VanZ family protein [Bacteroidia bacterium]